MLTKNTTILFQGDSITDCYRREDPEQIGQGYVRMTVSCLKAFYPELELTFLNRGISGDRVKGLKARWQEDCLDLKPDLLFILIGINDTWRRYDSADPTDTAVFEADYDFIIKQALNAGIKIILMEPFLLPTTEQQKQWWEDLGGKQRAVHRLARKYHLPLIPLDGLFQAAAITQDPASLTPDGVHPGPAGMRLITQTILDTL